MSIISDAVGLVYEYSIQKMFPALEMTRKPDHPDFTAGTFYIEAKAGHKENGAQIKRYQVEGFPQLDKPTVYFFGYHETRVQKIFGHRKNKARLVQNLIDSLYFPHNFAVSQKVVEAIWEQESQVNTKETIEYCRARRYCCTQLINGGVIMRDGKQHEVYDYYGINPAEFVLQLPTPRTFGTLLHKVDDAEALAFLKRHKRL